MTLDELFEQTEKDTGVPASLLRAFAWAESGLDPTATSPTSDAAGMFQILSTTLRDYNKATKSELTREDLFKPERAVQVAAWLIRSIAARLGLKLSQLRKSKAALSALALSYTLGSYGVPALANAEPAVWTDADPFSALVARVKDTPRLAKYFSSGTLDYVAKVVSATLQPSRTLLIRAGKAVDVGAPLDASPAMLAAIDEDFGQVWRQLSKSLNAASAKTSQAATSEFDRFRDAYERYKAKLASYAPAERLRILNAFSLGLDEWKDKIKSFGDRATSFLWGAGLGLGFLALYKLFR